MVFVGVVGRARRRLFKSKAEVTGELESFGVLGEGMRAAGTGADAFLGVLGAGDRGRPGRRGVEGFFKARF